MTSNNTSGRRGRIMTGVILVTAGTSLTGLLGAAAPANAAPDAYVVLSAGDINDDDALLSATARRLVTPKRDDTATG